MNGGRMKKKAFLMYTEYEQQLEDLSDEELGKLMRAIFKYEKDGTKPNFTGLLKMAFSFIMSNLNSNQEKYDKRCETSAQNGSKGGRPRNKNLNENLNENLNKNLNKPNKTKKANNDDDNDNDNEDDNDKNNVKDDEDDNIYEFLEQNFGYTISPTTYQTIQYWLKEFNNEYKIIKYGIRKCCHNNVKTISYLEGILKSWKDKGFKTLEECENENKKEEREPVEVFDCDWLNEEEK